MSFATDMMDVSLPFYGISMVPKAHWENYGYALLTIAGSDGEVSGPELDWLVEDLAQHADVDEAIVASWRKFDYLSADLMQIFSEIDVLRIVSFNRLLIYDAIRMSWADDDYADDERQKVGEAANILKVNPDTVITIEALVELERAAHKLRMTIF